MISRLALWGFRRYMGGTSRSWVFTAAAMLGIRAIKSVTGRRELVDTGDIKPGRRVEIEHLQISHRRQIRELKSQRKTARNVAKAEKAAAKEARRAAPAGADTTSPGHA